MAFLNIKVSRIGVDKVTAETSTIADIQESSELMKATSMFVRLLHEGVWEYFADDNQPPLAEPEVLIPTFEDGMDDKPRRITVQVGNGPRDPFEDPPQWFIDSLKKAFPDSCLWGGIGDGEAAVMVFRAELPKPDGWLDHWGFVGVGCDENGRGGKEVLISEPYGISLKQITELAPFLEKLGWTFNVVGRSAHYPSATLRIEIQPK